MFFYAVENFAGNNPLEERRIAAIKRTGPPVCGADGKVLRNILKTLKRKGELMYSIDLQSRTPIYEQLYKKIIELILKRELLPNDKLPSVRELAKELGVNPNTVSKAFQLLERDKVIYSLAGRGSFVAKLNAEAVKDAALADFDKAVGEALNAGIKKEELTDRINRGDDLHD